MSPRALYTLPRLWNVLAVPSRVTSVDPENCSASCQSCSACLYFSTASRLDPDSPESLRPSAQTFSAANTFSSAVVGGRTSSTVILYPPGAAHLSVGRSSSLYVPDATARIGTTLRPIRPADL